MDVKVDMINEIVEVIHDYAMPGTLDKVEIITSKLSDHAGIIGGAVLASQFAK